MIEPCLIGALCGALLGSRFKIFAMVPILAAVAAMLGGFLAFDRITFGDAAVYFLCWSTAVQLGYVGTVAVAALLPTPLRVGRTSKA